MVVEVVEMVEETVAAAVVVAPRRAAAGAGAKWRATAEELAKAPGTVKTSNHVGKSTMKEGAGNIANQAVR